MPKKRISNKRKPNKRILILCEGEKTEPNYFKGLKSDKYHRNKLAALRIEVHDTEKNTAKELVKEAKELKKTAISEKNPYDDIWIVIDKDGYTRHPQAFNMAKANHINVAFSSISFEYWFLLHFQYTTKMFQKADDLIAYLKTKFLPEYEKSNDNYTILKELTRTAIQNAARLRKNIQFELDRGKKIYELNPYTDVNVLVDSLLKL